MVLGVGLSSTEQVEMSWNNSTFGDAGAVGSYNATEILRATSASQNSMAAGGGDAESAISRTGAMSKETKGTDSLPMKSSYESNVGWTSTIREEVLARSKMLEEASKEESMSGVT